VKVLATYSIKGGVGKTTSAVNLAYEAGESGARVLVWDLDPQGAATFFLRTKPRVRGGVERLVGSKGELASNLRSTDFPAIHVVPGDFSLRHLDVHLDATKHPMRRLATLLDPLDAHYDVAILDCAPGITLTSESVFRACDALLVPTIPTPLSARTLVQLRDFLAAESGSREPPTLMPFLSMVDRRKKLQRQLVDDLRLEWPDLLPTAIPNASTFERMGTERAPVGVFAPDTIAAKAFRDLWSDIASLLWPG